jgi:hypothetical protein
MIVGSNHDEYRYWLMGVGNASATEADIADELVGYVGRNVLEMNLDLAVNRTLGWTARCRDAARDDLLRRIYAAYAGHSPFEHAVDFTTDFWFTVPTALAASTGTRARRARYLFQNDVEADTVMPLKTMHCTELPYVLGFEGFVWRYNSSDEDAVRDYFHAPTKARAWWLPRNIVCGGSVDQSSSPECALGPKCPATRNWGGTSPAPVLGPR